MEPARPPLCLTLELARARESWDPHAFAAGVQSYLLREAGGVYQGFELHWDEALARDLAEIARPDPDEQAVWRLGERLRRILLLAGWERADAAIGEAVAQGRRVFVDFIAGAAELYALPWELVPLRSTKKRLSEQPQVLLRYAWPGTSSTGVEPRPVGGRVLFAWSDAADPVPWRAQEQVIRGSVEAASPLAPLHLEVLPRAGARALEEALGRSPSVLHLLCHGVPGAQGGLALHGPDGQPEVLDAAALTRLIAPAAAGLRLVVLCACGSGGWSSVDSQLGSLAQVVHRAGVTSVIAFRIPVSIEGANRVCAALYEGLLRQQRSLEDALLAAQQALVGLPTLDSAALQLLARAEDGLDTRPVVFRPYRGLLPFRREHRPFFFGRERVVQEVVAELAALVETPGVPDLLFVAGPSGVGKTSLLAAGVLPALEERWPGLHVHAMRPGAHPLALLQEALAALGEEGERLLLVDQFEELFTHGASREEIAASAALLWEAMQKKVRVLAAIRGDYLDRLGEVPLPEGWRLDALAYADDHRAYIPRLTPEELARAISRPAQVVGLALESGLCERILEDVGMEPGSLPLVQHALDLLWQGRRGRLLTLEAYENEIGGVDGALSRHADGVIQALQEQDRWTARRMLTELVAWSGQTTTSTRRRKPADALLAELGEGAGRVLDRLVEARLLVCDQGDATHPTTLEIAHEALIRRWPTLGSWLEEGAEARAARDWLRGLLSEREREPGFVLRGAQLAAAAEMRERFPGELPAEVLAFIEDSERAAREAAEREAALVEAERARIARESLRARRTLLASAVVAVGVLFLIGLAVHERRVAREERTNAAEERGKANAAIAEAKKATAIAEEERGKANEAIARAADKERDAVEAEARAADAVIAAEKAARAQGLAELAAARATEQAQAAEALRDGALQMLDEAKAQALALNLQSHDQEIVQRASALVDEDPTLAAVMLREVYAEDPMEIPGWADLAGEVLGMPLAERVVRGLPYPVVEFLSWDDPPTHELEGVVLIRDAGGRLLRWRPGEGGEAEVLAEGVVDAATGVSHVSGAGVFVLQSNEQDSRLCVLSNIVAVGGALERCVSLDGQPTRIDAVSDDGRSAVLSNANQIWWGAPRDQEVESWTPSEELGTLGPVVASAWAGWSNDQILVLTPGAPVRLRLAGDGGAYKSAHVVRRRGHRARLNRIWSKEGLLSDTDRVIAGDIEYDGRIDPLAKSAAVLRRDLTEGGENELWSFDLRPWPERLSSGMASMVLDVGRSGGGVALYNLLYMLIDGRMTGHETQLRQGASEAMKRGEPVSISFDEPLSLLIGYSSGALERRDLVQLSRLITSIDDDVSRFDCMELTYVVSSSDGSVRFTGPEIWSDERAGTWDVLEGHEGRVSAVGHADGQLVSAGADLDGTLRAWSLPGRSSQRYVIGDAAPVTLDWVKQPLFEYWTLLVGLSDQSVAVNQPGDERVMMQGNCASPREQGGCLLVEGGDMLLRVVEDPNWLGSTASLAFESTQGQVLQQENGFGDLVRCSGARVFAAGPAGTFLVHDCDQQWYIWDRGVESLGPQGQDAVAHYPELAAASEVQLSKDGRYVFAIRPGGSYGFWRRSEAGDLSVLREVSEDGLAAPSPDGESIFEAGLEGILWWSESGEWTRPSPCPSGAPSALEPLALLEGEGVAVGCSTGEVFEVVSTLDEPVPLRARRGPAVSLLESDPSGAWLLSQDGAGEVRLWALGSSFQGVGLGRSEPILSVAFSPKLEELAWLDRTGRLERMPLARLQSLPDTLWRATDDCLDVATRVRALGATDEEAEEQIAACEERQAALKAPAPPPPSSP